MTRTAGHAMAGWAQGRVLVIALMLGSQSCCSKKAHLPPPGKVHVDRPEVFTRERLIRQRVEDLSWLQGKLNEGFNDELQGARDFREFKGAMVELQATFDPLGGTLKRAQSDLEVDRLKDQRDLQDLQHQIDMLKLERQLEQLRQPGSEIGNPPAAPSPSSPGATAPTSGGLTSIAADLKNRPGLPSATDIVRSQAKATSEERFRDEQAFRQSVRGAMREAELDDAHDLHGLTLYTLKFDVSVIPGGDGDDRFVRVELTLNDGADDLSPADRARWLTSLQEELADQAVDLQDRAAQGRLTHAELVRLWIHASDASAIAQRVMTAAEPRLGLAAAAARAAKTMEMDLRRRLDGRRTAGESDASLAELAKQVSRQTVIAERTATTVREERRLLDETAFAIRAASLPPSTESMVWPTCRMYLALLTRAQYEAALGRYVEFVDADAQIEGGYRIPRVKLDENESKRTALNDFLKKHGPAPYVYSVEPKQQGQNVSDVAAREKLASLVLSIKAALPLVGGLDGGAYGNFLRQSQERVEALLRRPLVVGFANNETKFGWILGPRFRLDEATRLASFEHIAVQHSLHATVAVPAWWQRITLKQGCEWGPSTGGGIEENGEKTKNQGSKSDDQLAKGGQLVASLPMDLAALTMFLRSESLPNFRPPPRIDFDGTPLLVRAGRTERVVIRGSELWRNPVVLLGTQPATDVRVLPNMKGLIAEFRNLEIPARYSSENPSVDLTVVTSYGTASVRNAVTVLPADEKGVPPARITLKVPRVMKGGVLQFTLPSLYVPSDAYAVRLRVKPKGSKDWYDVAEPATVRAIDTEATVRAVIDLAAIGARDETAEIEVDVLVQRSATAPIVSILGSGIRPTVAYFAVAPESLMAVKGAIVIKRTDETIDGVVKSVWALTEDIAIEIQNEPAFALGFPGLAEALQTGLKVIATTSSKESRVLRAARAGTGPVLRVEREPKSKTLKLVIEKTKLTTKNDVSADWVAWLSALAKPTEVNVAIEYADGERLEAKGTCAVREAP